MNMNMSMTEQRRNSLLLQAAFLLLCTLLATTLGFSHVLLDQIHGVTTSFSTTNFPNSPIVQQPWSGYTGILYAVPAFLPYTNAYKMTPLGRVLWVLQGVFSVLADHTYIGVDSPSHGIDRILATWNFLRLVRVLGDYRGVPYLWTHFLLAGGSLGSHLLARSRKLGERWEEWVWWHGVWHVTSTAQIIVLYIMVNRGSGLKEGRGGMRGGEGGGKRRGSQDLVAGLQQK